MAIEAALVKPVVDAILGLARAGRKSQLKADAEKAVREAIRELLLADPNEDKAAARIAIAKAAGLLNEDVLLAERMLASVRANAPTKKPATKRPAKKATKTTATKAVPAKTAKKKAT